MDIDKKIKELEEQELKVLFLLDFRAVWWNNAKQLWCER